MRSLLAASLLLGAVPLLQGCCLGSVSRFDGEWPLPPGTDSRTHWDEVASGDGGALLRERGSSTRFTAITPGGARSVELARPLALAGATVADGALYRVTREGVVRSPLDDPERAETVARIESARAVAVSGDTVVVVRPGAVVLARGASARTIWRGEALGVAVDPRRKNAWIVAREPLPVIDVVALDDGEVVRRLPLPESLESPNVRVTFSGDAAIVWAHDRPLEAALVVAPDLSVAWLLREAWDAHGITAGRFEKDSSPPLLVPSSGSASAGDLSFGRVAPSPTGGFLVVSIRPGSEKASVVSVARPASDRAPAHRRLSTPDDWPGVVAGVTWDQEQVVIATDERRRLRVSAALECSVETPVEVGTALRHGFNYVFNSTVAVGEVAVSIPFGVAFGCLVAPFGPPLFLVSPEAGLLAVTAPFWFPFVRF